MLHLLRSVGRSHSLWRPSGLQSWSYQSDISASKTPCSNLSTSTTSSITSPQSVYCHARCGYHGAAVDTQTSCTRVIDLRSDTMTKPTPAMREAMANAEVGDDVYGEDPTVNELQRRCAELFGMEATLFVPTGTMGNLISILTHCQRRGSEAIIGHKSHILINEQGGIAQFAGVNARTIENKPNGTFCLDELRNLISIDNDVHHPRTRMIGIENTHNFCGGTVLPMDFLKQLYEIANRNGVAVHVDGARILNAAVALGIPVSEILKYAHSVSMCFSKGLAAPVGSIIGGSKKFIEMALRMRKALGGGTRQAGILAAAAIVSLDQIVPRLHEDHSNAKLIANAINCAADGGAVDINLEGVHTNIVMINMVKDGLTAAQFCQRMMQVTEEEERELGERIAVRMVAIYPRVARLVTYNDISTQDAETAIRKLQFVIREFGQDVALQSRL